MPWGCWFVFHYNDELNWADSTPALLYPLPYTNTQQSSVNEDINSMEEICAFTLICRYCRRRREQCANKSGMRLLSSSCGIIFAMRWIFVNDGIFQSYMKWLISYAMVPVLLSLPAGSSWCNSGDFPVQYYKIGSW